MCICLSQQGYDSVASSNNHIVEIDDTQRIGVTSEASNTVHAAAVVGDQAAVAQTASTTQPQGSCCTMS
jgi:hypothetical protein